MKIDIVYEDKNLLAVNKPAGLLVHSVQGVSSKETLVDWLKKHYPSISKVGDDPLLRPGIVHRLDRDTSGVILIAKNQDYFNYLKKLFQNHEVKKTYLALVFGKVAGRGGLIDRPIGLKPGTTKRTVFVEDAKMIKLAETEYRVKKYLNFDGKDYTFLEVIPKTGRTHQIRVHLASIGHPVVGDSLYGKKVKFEGMNRLFLHAESLEFVKNPGERIKISAELPEELAKFVDKNS